MPIYILGISAFYHDSAAALVRGGEMLRLQRRKSGSTSLSKRPF